MDISILDIGIINSVIGHVSAIELPTAAWDLVSFFKNAKKYAGTAGGALISMLGTVGVVWGAVLLIKKLMGGPQNQDSWGKIVLLLIIGGALMVGGFFFISNIAAGGKTTIDQLGGGFILLDQLTLVLRN